MKKQFEWEELEHSDPNRFILIGPLPGNQFEIDISRIIDGWECRLHQFNLNDITGERDERQTGNVINEFNTESITEAKRKVDEIVYNIMY